MDNEQLTYITLEPQEPEPGRRPFSMRAADALSDSGSWVLQKAVAIFEYVSGDRFSAAQSRTIRKNVAIGGLVLLLAGFWAARSFVWLPPSDFAKGTVVTIPEGVGLSQISQILAEDHVIRSPFFFKLLAWVTRGARKIGAGRYLFDEPQSLGAVAMRTVNADRGFATIKVTVPEGATSYDLPSYFPAGFLSLDRLELQRLAKKNEGYLFPDTYLFSSDMTAQDIVTQMQNTFDQKIAQFASEMKQQGISESQLVTMASILEAEANDDSSRRIVAGILWKRISLGMPLQVDATLRYATGRATAQLRMSDLTSDSPYNSYVHLGLPPTPISNPGAEALDAVIHPQKTPYLFFLTDNKGVMHYASTLAEHNANKAKYL